MSIAKVRYRTVPSAEYHALVIRLPGGILCCSCFASATVEGMLIDLECTCVGTQVEPIPFTEVWGI